MTPEHDVERTVGVRRHSTRPERAGGELGRACERRERDRVEPLDPRHDRTVRRPGVERVPEEEQFTRLAEHEHRRRECIAAGHAQPLAAAERQTREPARRLRAARAAILTRPRTIPVSPHVFGSAQDDESARWMRGLRGARQRQSKETKAIVGPYRHPISV